MAKFESKPCVIDAPAEKVFSKLDDLTKLRDMIDKLPEEAKSKIGDVTFEKDSISINTQQVGTIKFVVKERIKPQKIVFGTESSPVPLTLTTLLHATGDDKTEITAQTDVDVPAMLKPMISSPMQKATDQFATLIAQLAAVE